MTTRYYRKIIHICADDSPNVKFAKAEIASGKEPSGRVLIPGVITYDEYLKRRKMWDEQMQCISLDGKFYEGKEVKLFPIDWINYGIDITLGKKPPRSFDGSALEEFRATKKFAPLKGYQQAEAMGVDPGEGGANTSWCIGNKSGMIELISMKTPDTTVIPEKTIELIHQYNLDPSSVYMDEGGGGLEHAQILRRVGYKIGTVFFGEAATDQRSYTRDWKSREEKVTIIETKFAYKNRRAEMYHKASLRCNPAYGGYALIPENRGPQYKELYRQLLVMPRLLDQEGRIYLPPKDDKPNSKEVSLRKMLGCSPDEADSFVLMNWGLEKKSRKIVL